MARCLWFIVLVAACGKSATPRGTELGNQETAASPACPTDADAAAIVRDAWSIPSAATVETVCTTGHFPDPGWVIEAMVDVSEGEGWKRTLVADAATRHVLAQSEEEGVAPWARDIGAGLAAWQAIDFDGDGVDEVVTTEESHHGGTYVGWYQVFGLSAGALTELVEVTTSDGNDEGGAEDPSLEYSCESTVDVGPADGRGRRPLIVTAGALKGGPRVGACDPSSVRVLVNGQFVPVDTP